MNPLSRSKFLATVTGKPSADVEKALMKEPSLPTDQAVAETKKGSLEPYKGEWGQQQILHLLRRSLFGVSMADYTFFSKLTLDQALDHLLTPSQNQPPPVNVYNDSKYTDPDVMPGETWVNCPTVCKGETDTKRINSLTAWWIGLMLNQDRSLTEKMTLFWHNHLAASFNFINDSRASYNYLVPLRAQAFGNFKKLAFDITTSTGMLQYLGGYQSKAEAPNENYSRELQELFTIGKGSGSHYTQQDVVTAARVLTGWATDDAGITTSFKPDWHDTGDKKFSAFYNNKIIKGKAGISGAEETSELIDMLFNNHEVALHTCRCLYRWFIAGEIDGTTESMVIAPLADKLIAGQYEIVPVLRALLGSEHFFDADNMGRHVKNPVDFLIGNCRQFSFTNFPSDITNRYRACGMIARKLETLGMLPGYPPSVAGWPAYYQTPGYYRLWMNSDTIVKRFRITDDLFCPTGLVETEFGFDLQLDVIAFTAQLSNPADITQLILDSTTLLSPVKFDEAETGFLKKLLLWWPEDNHTWNPSLKSKLLSHWVDENAWHQAWMAYVANPNDTRKKNAVINRLRLYYSYLLQQMECHLI